VLLTPTLRHLHGGPHFWVTQIRWFNDFSVAWHITITKFASLWLSVGPSVTAQSPKIEKTRMWRYWVERLVNRARPRQHSIQCVSSYMTRYWNLFIEHGAIKTRPFCVMRVPLQWAIGAAAVTHYATGSSYLSIFCTRRPRTHTSSRITQCQQRPVDRKLFWGRRQHQGKVETGSEVLLKSVWTYLEIQLV